MRFPKNIDGLGETGDDKVCARSMGINTNILTGNRPGKQAAIAAGSALAERRGMGVSWPSTAASRLLMAAAWNKHLQEAGG